MRTICVTGKGKIKVHPDMTRIVITLEGRERDYSKTLKASADSTEVIKDIMEMHGFKRSDVKTLSFSVDSLIRRKGVKFSLWN